MQLCNIKKNSKFSKKKKALRKHKCPRFSQKNLVKNNDKILLKKNKITAWRLGPLEGNPVVAHMRRRCVPSSDSSFVTCKSLCLLTQMRFFLINCTSHHKTFLPCMKRKFLDANSRACVYQEDPSDNFL